VRQADHGQREQELEAEPVPQRHFHYPWRFVSAQVSNAKGEIFYPVNDNRDRQWARRLEWVIEQHRDLAEDDLDEMETEMRQSKQGIFRKYDQEHIATLNRRLDRANQALLAHRLYAHMA
jgi:hypothetical protein